MVHLNSVCSLVADNQVPTEIMASFLSAHVREPGASRVRRALETSGNRMRYTTLPLDELARLGGAGERGELYRRHAAILGERAVAGLLDIGAVDPRDVSTIVCVSGTGWIAPSTEVQLIRRFGLSSRCRRIPLTHLGCAGGVAALSLAAELVRHDANQRVLVVSIELPSLQLQLGEPSYWEIVTAGQFGDGAAAAIVSSDSIGPAVLDTRSVLLDESDEGGRVVPCETGLRLVASSGLPRLVRSRVGDLVTRFTRSHGVESHALSFVVAHPRGAAVLDAIAEGLELERAKLAASYAAWESTANMVSASAYRAIAELTRQHPPRAGELGMLIAFGIGVACEMALLRWHSPPNVAYT